jgi:putative glutamine transport system substrate-binding protein
MPFPSIVPRKPMDMKKLYLLLLFCSQLAVAQKYGGDSWATIKSKGSGKLAVVYYPQKGMIIQEGGKMTGFCVDLLNDFVQYVETKHGKKITIDYQGEEKVYAEFLQVTQSTPTLLGVSSVTVTEERKKIMKFTPIVLYNQIVLVTHKSAPSLDNIKNIGSVLKGYSAKVMGGSVFLTHIEQIKKDNMPSLIVSTGANSDDILNEISTNPKLFTLIDLTQYVEATRRKLPVKMQNVKIGPAQERAFSMSKKSDWDEIWNEFLTPEYRKSEKYHMFIVNNVGSAYFTVFK